MSLQVRALTSRSSNILFVLYGRTFGCFGGVMHARATCCRGPHLSNLRYCLLCCMGTCSDLYTSCRLHARTCNQDPPFCPTGSRLELLACRSCSLRIRGLTVAARLHVLAEAEPARPGSSCHGMFAVCYNHDAQAPATQLWSSRMCIREGEWVTPGTGCVRSSYVAQCEQHNGTGRRPHAMNGTLAVHGISPGLFARCTGQLGQSVTALL